MADERTTDQQNAQGEEQSGEETRTDQAASGDSGVEVDGQTDETDAVELIGQEEFDSLKSDPVKLRKELNRAATRKFQELATERKALEPYLGFIQALDENPQAAITAIGKKLGLDIRNPEEKTGEEIATQTSDRITDLVKKQLGPEYEDLADRLAPAIRQVAEEVAKQIAAPLAQQQQDIVRDSALRESKTVIEAFTKTNPGWQKHEKAMVALSHKLPPGEGMDEMEYMNTLYYLVTRDASEGDTAKRLAARMSNNAKTATDTRRTVADTNVSKTPPKPPTFREAYEAAKEGRRLE